MKPVGEMSSGKITQGYLDTTQQAQKTGDNPQFGDYSVKSPSGWGTFGRIVLGIVTLGISELVRWAVSKSEAPKDANRANQALVQDKSEDSPLLHQPLKVETKPVQQQVVWEGPLPHESKPVNEITREEMRNAYGVSPRELYALGDYTAKSGSAFPDYKSINTYLRSNGEQTVMGRGTMLVSTTMKKQLDSHVLNMQNGLTKLPDYQGQVFRGAPLSSEQIEKYKVGETITEPSFSSASRSERVAEGYAYGGAFFVIESKHGKSIEGLSSFSSEQEVLFKAGTQFEVVSNDGSTIHLREKD